TDPITVASTTTQTGKPAGHQWAVLMATSGKKHWPPMGRTQWPLTYVHLKQWLGLATRYVEYAIVYRAAVVLNAVLTWSKLLSDTP
ncbi:hypothetical protein SAMN04487849_1051, partial [Micrococcus luteus]